MSNEDQKIDQLLKEFSGIKPSADLMDAWAQLPLRPERPIYQRFVAGVAVGLIVGFLFGVGLWSMKTSTADEYSATFASITVKYEAERLGGNHE